MIRFGRRAIAVPVPFGVVVLAALLLLTFFFALHLGAPPARAEEAEFVAWALSGPESFARLLPHAHRHLAYVYACMALWPFFGKVLAACSHAFGMSLIGFRAPSLLFGIASLILFGEIVMRLTDHRGVFWGTVTVFALSDYFWLLCHYARPETFILSVTMLNLLWVWARSGRAAGFLAGALATLAIAYHQGIVLLYPVMAVAIFMVDGKTAWRQPRVWWWAVGAFGGLIVAAAFLDVDAGMQYILLSRVTRLVETPPLIEHPWRPDRILVHGLRLWTSGFFVVTPYRAPFTAIALSSLWMLGRRYKAMAPGERFAIGLALSFLAALFATSGDPKYVLYVMPWLILAAMIAAAKLWRGEIAWEGGDALGAVAATTVALSVGQSYLLWLWLVPGMIVILSRARRPLPLWALSLAVLALVCVCDPDILSFAGTTLRYWVHQKPVMMAIWLLYPVAGIRMVLKWPVLARSRAVAAAISCYFVASTIFHVGLMRRDIARATPSASFGDFLRKVDAPSAKILGPGPLLFYARHATVLDSNELSFGPSRAARVEIFLQARPNYVVVGEDQVDVVREFCGDRRPCDVYASGPYDSPYGPIKIQEVHLAASRERPTGDRANASRALAP